MFWYRGLARISFRVRASGACRRIRSSHDCLVSSMAAHSWPRALIPAARKASSGTRCSVLPMPSRPRASASRRAGSTVSTSTLLPCRMAAITAAAAAVVVLPTPPGPQATTISLVASRPSMEPLPAEETLDGPASGGRAGPWAVPGRAVRPPRVDRPAISSPAPRPGTPPPGGWSATRGNG